MCVGRDVVSAVSLVTDMSVITKQTYDKCNVRCHYIVFIIFSPVFLFLVFVFSIMHMECMSRF